jgi:transcriptional regulator with XRE-family HTH domain
MSTSFITNLETTVMDMQDASGMGPRIAVVRVRRGISQAALARAIGVSATAISKLESGETRMLRADHLLRIAVELGADPVALVFGEDSAEYVRITESWPDANSALIQSLRPRERHLLSRLIEAFIDACRKTG